MDELPDSIPSAAELERKFNRRSLVNFAVGLVVLLGDAWMLYILSFSPGFGELSAMAWTVLLATLLSFWGPNLVIFFQKKKSLRDLPDDEKIGRYSAGELRAIMKEVLEPYRKREVPNVYVVESFGSNAYVMDSLFFNFIPAANAVYLSRRLAGILNRGELKAVIGHELSHFYRYIFPLKRITFFYYLFLGLLPIYISFHLEFGWVLMLWLPIFYLGKILFYGLTDTRSKDLEFLCDLQSARRYGKLNMINGLISVFQASEMELIVADKVISRIKNDNYLSLSHLTDILQKVEDRLPRRLVTKKEVIAAIDEVFSSSELDDIKKRLSREELKSESETLEVIEKFYETKEFKLIDWSLFDFDKPDMKISETEYPFLVKALIDHPERQLFNLEEDNKGATTDSTHPTFSERVLFLEKSGVEL